MARTALTVSMAGAFAGGVLDVGAAAVAAHTDGNSFQNSGVEKLVIVNGSGGSLTVTVPIPANPRSLQGLITGKTYTIAAGKTAIIGPFEGSIFNQANNAVHVDFSAITSVTIAVVGHVPTPAN